MANFTVATSTDCLQSGDSPLMGLIQIELMEASVEGFIASTNPSLQEAAAAVAVDKIMVEPGEWGRFRGMHVRSDLGTRECTCALKYNTVTVR
jgi:hypothetical protein